MIKYFNERREYDQWMFKVAFLKENGINPPRVPLPNWMKPSEGIGGYD